MRRYDKIVAGIIMVTILLGISVNVSLAFLQMQNGGRPWLVEVNRISLMLDTRDPDEIDLSGFQYVTGIEQYGDADFYNTDREYCIREINGMLYRFDYVTRIKTDWNRIVVVVNLGLGTMTLFLVIILLLI